VRAFGKVISTYPKFDPAPQLKFGYAQALEGAGDAGDTLNIFRGSNPFARRSEAGTAEARGAIIAAYTAVTKDFPSDEAAALSFLRIAAIMEEKLGDLENARIALETVVKKYSQFPGAYTEATLRLGDVFIALGRLEDAAAAFKRVAGTGPAISPQQERAALRLAELDYFQGKFQEAQAKLKSLTTNPASDATNDALGLQIFIQENLQSAPPALADYARADLLARQQKLSESLDRFQALLTAYPKSDLVDETLISIGDLYTRMGRYADADSAYTRLIDNYPESIVLDRTMMKLGEVYEFGAKDIPKAIAAYQRLLEKFPNSIYVSEARKRVRALRGDTI
jgi:TolA-binding protein